MSDYTALHEPIIPMLRMLLQTVALEPGSMVLDLASGSGEKLPLLHETLGGAQIIALDYDRHVVAKAQIHGMPLLVGNAYHLPLHDESCDLVVCIAALGLFANQFAALQEVRRVLRSSGQALLVTAEQRWAQVTNWPVALVDMFATLPPAHADHAEAANSVPLAVRFACATSYAMPLATAQAPVAAALSLCDWAQVAPQVERLPAAQRHACKEAHANAEIALCDMCIATLACKR